MQVSNNIQHLKYIKHLDPKFKADLQEQVGLGVTPSCLEAITISSDIIALGRFEGILQHRHSPRNGYGPRQNTIYEFRVESYLKSKGEEFIKIFQFGGPLAWQDKTTKQRGVGYKITNIPFPLIFSRYIIFMIDPKLHNRLMALNGYTESTHDGIKGIYQYADELNFTYPEFGKILLRNGKAFAGQVVDTPEANWDLGTGPVGKLQITNVSEKEAIQNIQRVVALHPGQIIRRIDK